MTPRKRSTESDLDDFEDFDAYSEELTAEAIEEEREALASIEEIRFLERLIPDA